MSFFEMAFSKNLQKEKIRLSCVHAKNKYIAYIFSSVRAFD
jgi:hypothetical protein